jgi:hypothetical protein
VSLSRIAAAAAVLVVTVVFGSQLTTGALWASSNQVGTGTISAGTLNLVNGSSSTQSASYSFTALNGSNLAPGGSVQAPLTVTSTGDIDYTVRLKGVTQGNSALAGQITVRVIQVASAATCTATGDPAGTTVYADGPLESASSAYGAALAPGSSSVYCIRVKLAPGATSAQSDQTTSLVFTFTGRQARNV